MHHATCGVCANGAILPSIQGGLPPFQFLWSNGATTSTLSAIGPGQYGLTITDAIGCQHQYAYLVTVKVGSEEPSNLLQCSIAPNPVAHTVKFAFMESTSPATWLRILDAQGRIQYCAPTLPNTLTLELDIQNWPNGLYHCQWGDQRGWASGKFLKM